MPCDGPSSSIARNQVKPALANFDTHGFDLHGGVRSRLAIPLSPRRNGAGHTISFQPTRRRSLAYWMRERFQIAMIRSCRLAGLSRAAWYKRTVAKDQSALLLRIRDIADRRQCFGHLYLRDAATRGLGGE
jgi:hypothetical protein